jgi:hypothetical protein
MAGRAEGSVIFFFHLVQDLELLIPLMKCIEAQGVSVVALLHFETNGKYPNMGQRFTSDGLPWAVYDERVRWGWMPWLRGARAVVTACDASVIAHQRGYRFVRKARWLRVPTFTLQHGLENIGLNYSDSEFPIQKVRFASRYILTWADQSKLHPQVSRRTRRKTTAVGVLKDLPQSRDAAFDPSLITIFENLHWGRYSERFRESFLNSLTESATALPATRYVLKPHPAGRWITRRYKGEWKPPANVEILDPLALDQPTTGEWIARSALVLTTPSTIALDAALMKTPVGVFGFDLDIPRFSPLPTIRTTHDWVSLVESVNRGAYPSEVLDRFVSNNSVNSKGLAPATQFILSHSS